MKEFEPVRRMREFLDWIANEGESHSQAWLRYERVLIMRYCSTVIWPEDFASTVMVEAASTFKSEYPAKYGKKEAGKYVFGVARHLVHEHYRPPSGAADPPEPPPVLPVEVPAELLLETGRVKRCLDGLGADKDLLLEYLKAQHGGHAALAARFDVAPGTLRTRISRLLARLRQCVLQP